MRLVVSLIRVIVLVRRGVAPLPQLLDSESYVIRIVSNELELGDHSCIEYRSVATNLDLGIIVVSNIVFLSPIRIRESESYVILHFCHELEFGNRSCIAYGCFVLTSNVGISVVFNTHVSQRLRIWEPWSYLILMFRHELECGDRSHI